ncbi:VTT domain-containing protein [Occallatibacter riparius]|uniref:VTT domain-containing protein n=1 Tax=Occallatibacter riparius TaxID=1002689 RepID=A0A9J7BV38_9BACT|nr:VTT domain-containing protein [Occallatibacter riparius]UWZ85634.1 VTT domain-containing protein [Occallatibacter riparius]
MSFSFLESGAAAAGGKKSSTFHWLARLGAPGVFAVSLVDATIIPLAVPGSTDLLLLWLISRGSNPYLLVSCGVIGSLIGGWTTWRLGKKGGEAAIGRYVPPRLQKRVQGWAQKHPMLAVFLPAILPPPIPLWPFLLAAGALGATARRFLLAFGAGRTLRYSLMGWLAIRYGRHIIKAWSATLEKWSAPIMWTFTILTVAGLAFSIWKLRRSAAREANRPGNANDSEQPLPRKNYSQLT